MRLKGLTGVVKERQGKFEQAKRHYENALKFAKDAHYIYGEAVIHNRLGTILTFQYEFEQATYHFEQAYRFFSRRPTYECIGKCNGQSSIVF